MRIVSLKPLRFAAGTAFALASIASAQVTGTNKPAGEDTTVPTISVTSRLVVETVTVKDKAGKPVSGLTAKDFTITEDGVAQKISFCEHQVLSDTTTPLPASTPANENIHVYNKLGRTAIAAENAGEVKYRDKRLIALYFDMTAMPPPDQLRAELAAEKFIREQMTSSDLISILRYAGSSVDVLQDFTDDRNRLLSIMETLVVGEGQGSITGADDESAPDTGAAFGQDDAEFNIFTTDRQLSALQTAAEMLGRLNEKKELIYFASGLRLNGLDNQAQLHATEYAAIRAGVSFWPIDARGLVAMGPLGDATQGSPGGQAMYTGASNNAMMSNFQRSQDTLFALAGDTGGKALLDNNDLEHGIIQAQKAIGDYYIIGYYTTNAALNGKFRKIKVTLNNSDTAANLDYRQGYFAGKEYAKFNTADKERQLEDALMQADPWTELTVAMEVNYFQLNRAEYYVPVMIKIPGSELALAKKRGADHATIDFVGEIKDEYGGTTVTVIRDHIDAKLSDYSVTQLAKSPIEYYSGYTLLPGKYAIKVLARDDQTGHIGTFQSSFVIPNLNKEVKHVALSSVVLGSQRVPIQEAIYNVAKGKDQVKQNNADPLVQNGQKLIPSVTRVFSKGKNLYVYLQAYQQPPQAPPASSAPASGTTSTTPAPAAAPASFSPQPLVAFVSFYQNGSKAYETQPVEVQPDAKARLGTAAMNFTIDLGPLTAGKYDCQVTVLDPNDQKSTFWQAPIMLVQ